MSKKSSPPPRRPSSAKVPVTTTRKTAPPPRKETMEVDMSWLEKEEAGAAPGRKGGKGPPPLPKPKGPPPLPKGPAPVRRETMEVSLEWLEEAEQAIETAKAQRRATSSGIPRVADIPDRGAPQRTKSSAKVEAVKPKRAPIPREDPDEPAPKRPSKRPPSR